MADRSTTEWTDASWNPTTGCTQVSPGCDHCYAMRFAERFRGVAGHPYEQGFDLRLWEQRLSLPLRWKTFRLGFVVGNDFPLTPPSGPHVRARMHPIHPQSDLGHPRGGIHQSEFGSDWQYWSRPFPIW